MQFIRVLSILCLIYLPLLKGSDDWDMGTELQPVVWDLDENDTQDDTFGEHNIIEKVYEQMSSDLCSLVDSLNPTETYLAQSFIAQSAISSFLPNKQKFLP